MSSIKTKWILEFGGNATAGVNQLSRQTDVARKKAVMAKSAFSSLKRTAGMLFSAYAIGTAVKGMFRLGQEAEATDTKFKVLTGSAENAHKMISEINQFANVTPFDNSDLKKSAELLLNYGFAQDKILPSLKMLGDVSGGNKEKLHSLTLAFAQVQSTGRLMGQDLLQMINAGFNPLQVISEKTGRSMAQLKEDMSKGKISAKDVEEAFRTATSEGGRFYRMMDQVAETASGKLSTLMGIAKTKIAEFSKNKLIPWLKGALDYSIDFVNGFGKVYHSIVNLLRPIKPLLAAGWNFIKTLLGVKNAGGGASDAIDVLSTAFDYAAVPVKILADGLTVLINWLRPAAPIIKYVAVAVGVLTAAQWAWNIAMSANPIGLVITGIAALIGGIKYAYNHFEKFRGIVDGAWAALKGFAGLIKNYVVGSLKDLLSGITGIGKSLYYFFTGEWKKAWETGKQATADLLGVNSKKQLLADAKQLGRDTAAAYDQGRAAIRYKDFDPGKSLAGIMSHKTGKLTTPNGGVTPVVAGDTGSNITGAGVTGSGIKAGQSSGGSGAGKSLTMNLDIKNIFNLASGTRQEIETIADQVVGRIVDKLRDAEIAMG